MLTHFLPEIQNGNKQALARSISAVENESPGYYELLKSLPSSDAPVIGITGPPGAGKSTLVSAITSVLVRQNKRVAILCIDPSSPFHHGAFLGDRIRMNEWTGNEAVYIRSLATRGHLGGLHPKIFEIADILKAAPYDYVILETVGIGQTEVDIAAIADCVALVLMPGTGDDIQALKAGILEIADLFVVNKSDHAGAEQFLTNLRSSLQFGPREPEILQTIATEAKGIEELVASIWKELKARPKNPSARLAEKAFRLILEGKMKKIDKESLHREIQDAIQLHPFNVYSFVENWKPEK